MNGMEGLEVGITVHVSPAYGSEVESVSIISGETKTCWRVDGELFRKSDGRTRGDGWYHKRIKIFTQAREDEINEERGRAGQCRRLQRLINHARFEYFLKGECSAISDLIEKAIEAHTLKG